MLYTLLVTNTGYDTHAKVDAMDWDEVQDVLTGWAAFPPPSVALRDLAQMIEGVFGARDGG